ncbi:hypothetical protein FA95DRAFT_1576767 [Auriscalpium vulgare]|uniref:Uncharacterized protein n=1 Tax=Auriscalpium vulgare TaxID=40419 RepID=A0ACB8RB26_9AGAM|nr:hypothetical protein FA95DRAFT_1576767 [Auriscalpium vulgare]
MPTVRVSSPTNNRRPLSLSARIFRLTTDYISKVAVMTVVPRGNPALRPRFPCAEAYLTSGYLVHDSVVTVQGMNGLDHQFLICFVYSSDLPVNQALLRLSPEMEWRGELLVMRQSRRCFVTAMGRSKFATLAEKAIISSGDSFLHFAKRVEMRGRSIPEDLPTHIHHDLDQTPGQYGSP